MRADHCPSIRQYGSCQACPIAGLHHSDSVGRPSVFGWGGLLNYSIVNVHVTPKDEQAVLCVPTRTEWWSRSLRQTPFQALNGTDSLIFLWGDPILKVPLSFGVSGWDAGTHLCVELCVIFSVLMLKKYQQKYCLLFLQWKVNCPGCSFPYNENEWGHLSSKTEKSTIEVYMTLALY